ncbi:MAG: ketopantoate reductase family protein [Nitrospinae bacterium]|nr:ketopantoate reductase family protein [Nitrospinota bacterium]
MHPSFLVVGSGAVGCYYGSKLQQAGFDVTFLARGKRYNYLKENPLIVESFLGDYTVKGKFIDAVTNEKPDFILFTTKSYDIKEACESIKKAVTTSTTIISFINGTESEKVIAEFFPKNDIIGGIAFIGAELNKEFILSHTAAGFILIGDCEVSKVSTRSYKLNEIADFFIQGNINCKISDNIYQDFWNKMLWNTGFNGLCAITGMTSKLLLEFPETRKTVIGLMKECKRVAIASGIHITDEMIQKNIEITEKVSGDVTPSMLQDKRNGKKMEIDIINGKVVALGKELGVQTPLNETINAIISLWNKELQKG